jgi:hypothetical protein
MFLPETYPELHQIAALLDDTISRSFPPQPHCQLRNIKLQKGDEIDYNYYGAAINDDDAVVELQ